MSVFSQSDSSIKISNLKAILLVTGTCIGGGMLAIPIQTAEIGFWLSLCVLIISWTFMMFTGFLLVEATLWVKGNTHFSSLSHFLLGRYGRFLSLVVYVFMNTSSLVAYTSGGANLVDGWLKNLLGISIGYSSCCILLTVLLGGFVYLGVSFVGRVNNWFSCLMGCFFLYLISLGFFRVKSEYLVFRPVWSGTLHAFPLILASFSYQMIVPSLCAYLNYEAKSLKKAIIIGTSIPFAVYFLWIFVIHGLIPLEGTGGLRDTAQSGALIVEPLRLYLASPLLTWVVDGFAFFALITSYLGLSLAFFDLIYDFFKESGIRLNKTWVAFLSFIPCLVLAIFFPSAFVNFLDLSGGFGDALLSGLIPVAMVWVGRYRKGLGGEYSAPGGKWALFLVALFALSIFMLQWIKLLVR